VDVVRSNPDLISSNSRTTTSQSTSSENWSGLPVIFDEVFTGIYRLGHFNTSALLGVWPDIIVNAKLLTGGLIPLCTTTASQAVFNAFLSDQKADALLHGHSYTAHAVGCNVAVNSLKTMERMNKEGSWTVFKDDWRNGNAVTDLVWSMWSTNFVDQVSKLETIDYVVTMGSVLAIALKDPKGSGKALCLLPLNNTDCS
jgi:dethiobiotin synthetase/adenosylmethionine--8-amino-7-oxononanoate aminotransferase